MSVVRFVFSVVMALVFLYFTITSVQNLMAAHEDLKIEQDREALFLAHGCSVSSDGTQYICPNGLPPGAS